MRSEPVGRLVWPLGVPIVAAWPIAARFSIGDVSPLVLGLFGVALVTSLWFAVTLVSRAPATKPWLVASVAVAGLGLGTEIGFAFGGGRRLVLWSLTLWVASHAVGLATLIVLTRAARPRTALYAWRRCQVVNLVLSAVVWLLVVTAAEVATGSVVATHGVKLDLGGGAVALFVLFAVSVIGEGLLARRALQLTNTWLVSPPRRTGPPPPPGESVLPYGPPRP